MKQASKSQIEKFRQAARDHDANESEDAFNAALKAIATSKDIGPATERLAPELGRKRKFKPGE